jgi:hypothetical protein
MMPLCLESVFTIRNKMWYIRRALPGYSGIPHIKLLCTSGNYKWHCRYEEMGGYGSIECLSNTFCSGSSDPLVLRAGDCLVRINSRSSFIYQSLKEYTNINFSKHSVLGTFIRKQRPNDCLTWNCTPDFRFHVMDNMLIYLTWMSCITLFSDLWVDRISKSCKLRH